MPPIAANIIIIAHVKRPDKVTPRCLFAVILIMPLLRWQLQSMDKPIRFKSLKFIQIMNALPTIILSGTKPQ